MYCARTTSNSCLIENNILYRYMHSTAKKCKDISRWHFQGRVLFRA